MKLNCYCSGQRSAVRILYVSALLLLTGFLSAYGANDLAVGVKNSTYYFDRQNFFIILPSSFHQYLANLIMSLAVL
jgi:hypothetical protein